MKSLSYYNDLYRDTEEDRDEPFPWEMFIFLKAAYDADAFEFRNNEKFAGLVYEATRTCQKYGEILLRGQHRFFDMMMNVPKKTVSRDEFDEDKQ